MTTDDATFSALRQEVIRTVNDCVAQTALNLLLAPSLGKQAARQTIASAVSPRSQISDRIAHKSAGTIKMNPIHVRLPGNSLAKFPAISTDTAHLGRKRIDDQGYVHPG